MTTFEDGPAKGQTLMLHRATIFLRVVVDDKASGMLWDALDQPDDVPKATEKLYAYQCTGVRGSAFVDGRDPKTGKRFGNRVPITSYKLVKPQPTDAEMRSTFGWQKWCKEEADRQKLNYQGKECGGV